MFGISICLVSVFIDMAFFVARSIYKKLYLNIAISVILFHDFNLIYFLIVLAANLAQKINVIAVSDKLLNLVKISFDSHDGRALSKYNICETSIDTR